MFTLSAFADEADDRLDGQVDALTRNGFSLLELRAVEGKNIALMTADEVQRIHHTLESAGIGVRAVGSPCGKTEIADDFTAAFDAFRRTLDNTRLLGASRMRIFSFYHTGIPFTDTLRDEVAARLLRFCEAARGSGVTLCHENEKGIYGDTADRCASLFALLPELRAVFDPANFAECGESVKDAWQTLYAYVDYLHVKDVAPDGRIVLPGTGICGIPELLRAYRAAGGTFVTLEPHLFVFRSLASLEKAGMTTKIDNARYATPREAFDAAADALKKLIKEVSE